MLGVGPLPPRSESHHYPLGHFRSPVVSCPGQVQARVQVQVRAQQVEARVQEWRWAGR